MCLMNDFDVSTNSNSLKCLFKGSHIHICLVQNLFTLITKVCSLNLLRKPQVSLRSKSRLPLGEEIYVEPSVQKNPSVKGKKSIILRCTQQ